MALDMRFAEPKSVLYFTDPSVERRRQVPNANCSTYMYNISRQPRYCKILHSYMCIPWCLDPKNETLLGGSPVRKGLSRNHMNALETMGSQETR